LDAVLRFERAEYADLAMRIIDTRYRFDGDTFILARPVALMSDFL
jgi:hypothetical protein